MDFNTVIKEVGFKKTDHESKISSVKPCNKKKNVIFHDPGGTGPDQIDFEACVNVLSGKKKIGVKKKKAEKVH